MFTIQEFLCRATQGKYLTRLQRHLEHLRYQTLYTNQILNSMHWCNVALNRKIVPFKKKSLYKTSSQCSFVDWRVCKVSIYMPPPLYSGTDHSPEIFITSGLGINQFKFLNFHPIPVTDGLCFVNVPFHLGWACQPILYILSYPVTYYKSLNLKMCCSL